MKGKSLLMSMVLIGMVMALAGACTKERTAAPIYSGAVSGSIVIQAPPEQVFSYVENIENAKQWNTGFRDVSDVEGEGLGRTHTWKTEDLGLTWDGINIRSEYVPNRKTETIAIFSNAEIHGCLTNLYLPHPEGTRLIFVRKYAGEPPQAMKNMSAGKITDGLQKSLEGQLKNIKGALEK
jgi:hypothetical protein